MDLIKKISTQHIPQWIPYPEGETTQRPGMRAYKCYYKMYPQHIHAELIIFI